MRHLLELCCDQLLLSRIRHPVTRHDDVNKAAENLQNKHGIGQHASRAHTYQGGI